MDTPEINLNFASHGEKDQQSVKGFFRAVNADIVAGKPVSIVLEAANLGIEAAAVRESLVNDYHIVPSVAEFYCYSIGQDYASLTPETMVMLAQSADAISNTPPYLSYLDEMAARREGAYHFEILMQLDNAFSLGLNHGNSIRMRLEATDLDEDVAILPKQFELSKQYLQMGDFASARTIFLSGLQDYTSKVFTDREAVFATITEEEHAAGRNVHVLVGLAHTYLHNELQGKGYKPKRINLDTQHLGQISINYFDAAARKLRYFGSGRFKDIEVMRAMLSIFSQTELGNLHYLAERGQIAADVNDKVIKPVLSLFSQTREVMFNRIIKDIGDDVDDMMEGIMEEGLNSFIINILLQAAGMARKIKQA